MNIFLITEKDFDAALILRLLGEPDLEGVELRASTAAYSLARTFLSGRRDPVVLLLDAHSSAMEVVSRLRQEAEEALGDAGPRSLFRVVVAVPELGVVFFQRPELLRRLYDGAVTEHLVELANYSARAAIQKLDPGEDYEKIWVNLFKSMTSEDVAAMRQSRIVKELIQAIQELRQRSLVSSMARI